MDRGDDGTAKGSRPGNRSGLSPDSVVTGRNAKRWEPGFFKEPRAKQQKLDYFPWSCDLCTLPCPDGEEPSYRRIFDDTFRPVMVVGGQKMSVAAAVVDVAESCSAWRSRINMLMAEDTGASTMPERSFDEQSHGDFKSIFSLGQVRWSGLSRNEA